MKNTHALPQPVSEYLQANFREGFLFDDIQEEKDEAGHQLFVTWINDGNMLHQMVFNASGTVCRHDIMAAYPEDIYEHVAGDDDFYEDDF